MYKKNKPEKTGLHVNKSYIGETMETKIQRIVNNKEPIKDSADIIYTDRSDGVQPAYNIRTDRMEVALEAMDMASKSWIAKREARAKSKETETKDSAENITKEVGKPENIPGTNTNNS